MRNGLKKIFLLTAYLFLSVLAQSETRSTAQVVESGNRANTALAAGTVGALSVKDFGATGNGTSEDGPAIQRALNTAAPNGLRVFVPCGTYVTSHALFMHSNTTLYGAGPCSLIKASPSIVSVNKNAPNPYSPFGDSVYLLTNYHWSAGDTNLNVYNIAFDLSNADRGDNHNIHFYNASKIRIAGVSTTYGGDGISGNAVRDVVVSNSRVEGVTNGGLDFWDGSSDITLVDNKVYCSTSAKTGDGIIFTGITSTNSASTTRHTRAIGNYVSGCYTNGIWVQGGWNGVAGDSPGQSNDAVISGNTVANIRGFHGIRASNANHVVISNNVIRNIAWSAITTQGETPTGGAVDVTISGNSIANVNSANGNGAAIFIGNGSAGVNVFNNQMQIGTHPYSFGIQIAPGATDNTVGTNDIPAGSKGRIFDQGAGTTTLQ